MNSKVQIFFSFLSADGELYTFGRAGPRLGYSIEGRKQATPRLVEKLKNKFITKVACGLRYTLGKNRYVSV